MIIKNYQLNFFVYCIYVCGVINSIFWTLITLKRLCLCESMAIDYKKHDICGYMDRSLLQQKC